MNRPIDGYYQAPTELPQETPPPLPTAAETEAAVPEGVNPEVQAAVDEVIDPAATAAERTAAYEDVQQYYDAVASGGDFTGIDPDSLRVNAIFTLTEAGIATKFDPRVVEAVDQAIKRGDSSINGVSLTGATDAQVLEAYQLVQDYVDQNLGVGGPFIPSDALPTRAEQVLRESGGIPTRASVTAEYVGEALDGFEDMSDEQKIAAIAEAARRLEQQTSDMDPADAARAAELSLPVFEQALGGEAGWELIQTVTENNYLKSEMVESLGRFTDRVAGTPESDAVIGELASLLVNSGFATGDQNLTRPLTEQGVGLPLVLRVAEESVLGGADADLSLQHIDIALDSYRENTVNPAVQAYSEHTAELNWLLQNLGPGASPERLQQATQDYIAANPGWQERHDELQAEVAAQGEQLLQQIEALRNLPAGIDDYAGDAEARIKDLLEDPSTGFAIATAVGTDPEAVEGLDLPELIDFAGTLGLADSGLGVVKSLATAHVQHNILGSLADIDPSNPAALANARAQIASLRNPAIATALGLDPADLAQLDAAVDELQRTLPQNGETLSQADVEQRLARLNTQLNGLSAFHESQPLGQAFRGIGVVAGIASLYGAASGFIDDPSLTGAVTVLSGAAGLSTTLGELATGVGAIPEGSPWARFSSNAAFGKVLGTVGLGLGLVGVVDSLSQGDLAQAGIGAVGIGGGALALFGSSAWAGPVGLVIGFAAAAASIGLNIFRANEAEQELEDASRPFLESLGFDPEAAEILSDFSGDGHSSVQLLVQYAEYKGYDLSDPQDQQTFVNWVNGLNSDTLAELRDALNHEIDDYGGDASELGSDTDRPPTEYDVNPSTGAATPRITVYQPGTVGEIDAFLYQRDSYAPGSILPQAS